MGHFSSLIKRGGRHPEALLAYLGQAYFPCLAPFSPAEPECEIFSLVCLIYWFWPWSEFVPQFLLLLVCDCDSALGWIESETVVVGIALHISKCFVIIKLKATLAHVSLVPFRRQEKKAQSGQKSFARPVSLVICLQIVVPLFSRLTMALPIITVISVNRIFQPKILRF